MKRCRKLEDITIFPLMIVDVQYFFTAHWSSDVTSLY